MTKQQLKETREAAYGMSINNLNPEDVDKYMEIAKACAVLESRYAINDGMSDDDTSE